MILTEPVDPETSLEALLERYRAAVIDVVENDNELAAETGLEESTIESAKSGGADALSLEVAAVILGQAEGMDAETAKATVRDHLLLAMSGAVMDVEALARAVDGDLEPGEVQAKVEGRLPMTLDEYARLHHAIARQRP